MSGAWSNDLTTSLTLPTGATNPHQRIVLDGTSDTILIYSSTGALIASIAATAGTDGFGNSYPAGISATSGIISQSIFLLYNGTPTTGNLVMSLTSSAGTDSFGNMYGAGFSVYSAGATVRNIALSGLDTIGLGTGSHFTMDPTNSRMTFFDSSGNTRTVINSATGAYLLYQPSYSQTFNYFDSNGNSPATNYSLTVPHNSSVRIQAWGAGGGGQGNSGAGGGGGEYAEEPVTSYPSGATLTINYGSGGSGGAGGVGGPGSDGGNTTVTGGAVTVTAHGGKGSTSATTAGGTGSTNAIHHDGGGSHANTTGSGAGGAGGGAAAGTTNTGAAGASNSGATGGAGGVGTNGGGSGGAGSNSVANSNPGGNGANPGGGGGASGFGTGGTAGVGGNGGDGKVIITVTQSNALVGVFAANGGTDQFGNVYPAGLTIGNVGFSRFYVNPSGPVMNTYDTTGHLNGQWNAGAGSFTSMNFNLVGINSFLQMSSNNNTGDPVFYMGSNTTQGALPSQTDLNQSAQLINNGVDFQVISPSVSSLNQYGIEIDMNAGQKTAITGGGPGVTPSILLTSTTDNQANNPTAAVDVYIPGSNIYTDPTAGFAPPGWKAPTMGTGWATGTGVGGSYPPLLWRIDAENNIHIMGVFHATSTTPSSTIASGFKATVGANVSVVGAIQKINAASISFGGYMNSSGNLNATTFPAIAVNDTFMINAKVPIGNLLAGGV